MGDTRGKCAICGWLPLGDFRIWFELGWLTYYGLCKVCEKGDRTLDELNALLPEEKTDKMWATEYIKFLQGGETVSFRPRGNSMTPRIRSGQLCTVAPVNPTEIKKGDVVLCKVRGSEYLHLVSAVQDGRFQISNNHGHVNGWITGKNIHGILISVEP